MYWYSINFEIFGYFIFSEFFFHFLGGIISGFFNSQWHNSFGFFVGGLGGILLQAEVTIVASDCQTRESWIFTAVRCCVALNVESTLSCTKLGCYLCQEVLKSWNFATQKIQSFLLPLPPKRCLEAGWALDESMSTHYSQWWYLPKKKRLNHNLHIRRGQKCSQKELCHLELKKERSGFSFENLRNILRTWMLKVQLDFST